MCIFLGIVKGGVLKQAWNQKDPCTYGMPTIEEFTRMRSSYNKENDIRSIDNKVPFCSILICYQVLEVFESMQIICINILFQTFFSFFGKVPPDWTQE